LPVKKLIQMDITGNANINDKTVTKYILLRAIWFSISVCLIKYYQNTWMKLIYLISK
jgi:hypothetical protein